ncbi:MAG: class I SAM-dependent methyltransferase [Lentisphaeria bacterium]
MNVLDIIKRDLPPAPWSEGDNIPWNDPDFSRRMLKEHLSQEHNLASRRFEIIDRQVRWIHENLLGGTPARILDLACGPGLYTSRLARLGHECIGIDYAPAAIHHAQATAAREKLACAYRLADLRDAEYGSGYGFVMMLFGQFNVFRRPEANAMLERACAALAPNGLLLLEPQRFGTVEKSGRAPASWYSCGKGGGLFSDRPHLCLSENFWDAGGQTATQRFFIVDAETGRVSRHALSNEAYSEAQLENLLARAGFTDIRFFPSLVGVDVEEESQAANLVVVGKKPAAASG